jgi:hypothetical protein
LHFYLCNSYSWTPFDYAGNYSFELGCEGPREWITDPRKMSASSAPLAFRCTDEFIVKFFHTKLTWIRITEDLRARGFESCFFAYDDEQTRVDQAVAEGTRWMF